MTNRLSIDFRTLADGPPAGLLARLYVRRTDSTSPQAPIYTDDAVVQPDRALPIRPDAAGLASIDLIPSSEYEQDTEYVLRIGPAEIVFRMPEADTDLAAILTGNLPPVGQTFYMGADAADTLAGQPLIDALTTGTTAMTRDPIVVPALAAASYLYFAQPASISDFTEAHHAGSPVFNQARLWRKLAEQPTINGVVYEVWVTRNPQNQQEGGQGWRFT